MTDQSLPILVVGDLCPDIVVAGVPTAGTSLRFGQAEDLVTTTTMTLGSSAGITACAIAAAEHPVQLLAVCGADEFGTACRHWLREKAVDAAHVRVDPALRTGSSVILVRSDDPGDRQILTDLGAMTELSVDDVSDEILSGAKHLHIASFFLHLGAREVLHTRMRRARELGLTTSLDTNDDPAREWRAGAQQAIAQADVLFVNESEARGLSGAGSTTGLDTITENLLAVMPRPDDPRFPAVVLKLGGEGAEVHTRTSRHQCPAPEVDVVDTVGAGDTLAGTCLAALMSGSDWPTALRLGAAAGSLSTTAAGGTAGQPGLATSRALATSLKCLSDNHIEPAERLS